MEKLVIDRQEWLRGEGSDSSYLYRSEDGKKCCLGFLGSQRGLTKEDMKDRRSPEKVVTDAELYPFKELVDLVDQTKYDNDLGCSLMVINDKVSFKIIESEREAQLKENFLKINVEVTFIN